MTRKVVVIESRKPRTKDERNLYGLTECDGSMAHIYINASLNRSGQDLLDTLYHEFTHVAVGLYKTKLNIRREEKLCQHVAKLVTEAFRNA